MIFVQFVQSASLKAISRFRAQLARLARQLLKGSSLLKHGKSSRPPLAMPRPASRPKIEQGVTDESP
jgi:hypothetical protein